MWLVIRATNFKTKLLWELFDINLRHFRMNPFLNPISLKKKVISNIVLRKDRSNTIEYQIK